MVKSKSSTMAGGANMRNRRTKNRKTTTKNPALEFIILLPEDPRYQFSRSSLPEDGHEGLLLLEKRVMAPFTPKTVLTIFCYLKIAA